MNLRFVPFLLALAASLAAGPAPGAEDAPPPARAAAPAPQRSKLPADSVTKHTLNLPDRKLAFKANVQTIHLADGKGETVADVVTTAFLLDGAEAGRRPVAFIFNGGPGSASAYLQFGGLGPWRLPLDGGPSTPIALIDNAETWLDFADLVFIDPPGTGYSRVVAEEARKRLWSVDGDIDALAATIRRWLALNERLASPKFVVGESYGGLRGPRLAEALATAEGVGVNGLILISPLLDGHASFQSSNNPMSWIGRLPSLAAVAREAKGAISRADLADVEAYARGEYCLDFLRGAHDAEAVARMSERVAALTGLDRTLVRQLHGRVPANAFAREIARAQGQVTGFYDGTQRAYDPTPEYYSSDWLDPIGPGWNAPLTSAAADLYARRLGFKTEERYEISNRDANSSWDWSRERHAPEAFTALRRILAVDPLLRVLVTHGLTDLVTPYFLTQIMLDQTPEFGAPGRVTLAVYPGGHMHYTREESRKALRRDAKALIDSK